MFNASLALVKQLERAGHRITYASPADLKERVTVQGIAYVQLDPYVIQWEEPPMGWWEKLRTLRSRQQQAVDALGVQNFVQTMQELTPDLLLIHNEMHPHIMAAVTAQFPVALLCTFLSVWRRPNLPPIHTHIVPGEGWRGQWVGIQWTWLRYSWRKWKEFQRDRAQRAGLDRISVLRCYARQIGHPFRARFGFTQWLVPYPHGPLPILCLNALEIDFPHNPHPLMHYVGPMVCADRQEPQVDQSTYKTLEQLFENRRSSGTSERALIYCSCSTFVKSDQRRLKKIIEAVAECPEWDLVLGLGGQLNPELLGTLPPNVYAFSWAPQFQILKQADCAVVDAGSSAVRECIYAGVPMLIYSRGHDDQNGNQTRVVYHGLGIAGDRAQDSAAQIRNCMQTLLTDRSYQTRINHMRERFQRYAHENRVVQVVEALLSQQQGQVKSALGNPSKVLGKTLVDVKGGVQ